MTTHTLHLRAVSLAVVGLIALSGCGGSDDEPSDSSSASGSSDTASPQPVLGGDQLQAIHDCLEAAGLSDTFPSGAPTDGFPSGGVPSGGIPSGTPPSGFPSGGPGGGLNDPDVQAALQACGISLPSAPPS